MEAVSGVSHYSMALVERGRSAAERTRLIDIRYFWVKERVDQGEAIIKHFGTKDVYANLLTSRCKERSS
jgi:hypothetical protein